MVNHPPGKTTIYPEVPHGGITHSHLHRRLPPIWLIDPFRRMAYTFGAAGLQEADMDNLTVPGTPIRINLTDIFARLDRKKLDKKKGEKHPA